MKALKGAIAGPDLLRLIPKLRVHTIELLFAAFLFVVAVWLFLK